MAIVYNKALPAQTYSISLPFTLSTNGKVDITSDSSPKAWKDRVLTLLSTGINERIWYYNYGASLDGLLYESALDATELGRQTVKEMFVSWLPQLSLIEVNPVFDDGTGTLSLTIIYKLPAGETDSVTISTASLTAAGELIEGS
jgi:phage baseplate assembly protein W